MLRTSSTTARGCDVLYRVMRFLHIIYGNVLCRVMKTHHPVYRYPRNRLGWLIAEALREIFTVDAYLYN